MQECSTHCAKLNSLSMAVVCSPRTACLYCSDLPLQLCPLRTVWSQYSRCCFAVNSCMNHNDVEMLKDMVHPQLMDTFRSPCASSHSNFSSVQTALHHISTWLLICWRQAIVVSSRHYIAYNAGISVNCCTYMWFITCGSLMTLNSIMDCLNTKMGTQPEQCDVVTLTP